MRGADRSELDGVRSAWTAVPTGCKLRKGPPAYAGGPPAWDCYALVSWNQKPTKSPFMTR